MKLLIVVAFVFFFFYVCYKILEGIINGIASLFRGPSREKPVSNVRIKISYSGDDEDDPEYNYFRPSGDTKDKRAATTWTPKEKSVTVKGIEISGGLIYVGNKLQDGKGWNTEPSLINPRLPVNKSLSALESGDMGYWPSYSRISPQCRNDYLVWLATGRCDPKVDIGYVFLYFYGLERRALVDTEYLPEAKNDLITIREEIKRLQKIYDGNRSFRGYAARFLDTLNLKIDGIRQIKTPPINDLDKTGLTISVCAALGKIALDQQPLKVQWALPWVWQDPDIPKNTSAKRCKDEFNKLFILAFTKKYPDGIKIKANKTILIASYHPASSGVPGYELPLEHNGQSVPNITRLKRPKNILADLVSECSAQLEPYSRFVGRNPDKKDSIAAHAMLPEPLLIESNNPTIKTLKTRLNESVNQTDYGTLPGMFFFDFWPSEKSEKFNKKESTALMQLLTNLGYGIEPDPRFVNVTITPQTNTVIFPLPAASPSAPSTEYKAACNLVRLATMISAADGVTSNEEQTHIEDQIENYVGLYPEERIRLKAHMLYLIANPTKLSGLNKFVEHITDSKKNSITRFLINVALADNHVDASEVKALEKIYQALGLKNDQLYSHIHSATTAQPAPTHLDDGVQVEPDHLPSINHAVLANKLKETEEVSAILAGILGEDNDTESTTINPNETASDLISGLDTAHSNFLIKLSSQNIWGREELEKLAEHLGIFIDGALDIINELSYDRYGGPVIDDDGDTYIVDQDILKGVMA